MNMKVTLFAILLLVACVFLGTAVDSHAHNRAGMVKITLDADTLNEDHVAYYFEAKVNSRIGDDGKGNRFFVWSFDNIETLGDKANVHVTIIDQKTRKQSKETLYMTRNSDGSWNHVDADGKIIEESIYTMITPPDYTQEYIVAGAAVAIFVLLGVMFWLRKKKKKEQAA